MKCARSVLSPVACPALKNFFTLSHKRHYLPKKDIEHKIRVLIFPQFLSETFLILRRTERGVIKNVYCLHVKYRYSCQILMNLEVYRQIFEKFSNIKFHGNPPSGSRVVPCRRRDRRTDRYDGANSPFSQFCESA
jgi:hypothetical protein